MWGLGGYPNDFQRGAPPEEVKMFGGYTPPRKHIFSATFNILPFVLSYQVAHPFGLVTVPVHVSFLTMTLLCFKKKMFTD